MEILNEQELHNLAMNVVGKDLEAKGFEFLAVNSQLKKDPQFVCLKNKKLHFVVVKAVLYPENPKKYDVVFMETIKEHALKFKARTYYAGVGIASADNYEKPVRKDRKYIVNYDGIQEII
ncbi:Na(+)-translocating NADH-quinone reductase subunit F [Sinomicrobium kalidii]|uniref:Na(+)-translocating NADH-quinone reductase subunit F n=1 Tax=Sinomicrobium kalidii TaxID=2900738 RepID=UPI001E532560|nr:Na(+)-translocating NADH-quinone reductase subunit F [Sinomicrobium kalidii]UGU15253.1 Na(+)-translocating NADH-quinone reductase subunit F [Sinomicrobium kalidii]